MVNLNTTTITANDIGDFQQGQMVWLNGKKVRIYPSSETQAHVYTDWPGRNRHERRRSAAEARRIK